MKALIIYDSKFGNTRKIAEAIAEVLGSNGTLIHADEFTPTMLRKIDTLIIGSPTQKWRPSPTIKSLLVELRTESLFGMKAAAFDTGYASIFSGSAARIINRVLVRSGCRMLAPPERFIVTGSEGPLAEGEIERAKDWARQLLGASDKLEPRGVA